MDKEKQNRLKSSLEFEILFSVKPVYGGATLDRKPYPYSTS